MTKTRLMMRLSLTSLLLLQTACVGSTTPARFYLLEPVSGSEVAAPASMSTTKPILSLAPVRIPPYLDRAQLVSATGKNTYQLNELHRWAESLGDNITRVMLQDLAVLVPADVVLGTNLRAKQALLRLAVNILEFHIDSKGQAGLVAQWQVSRGDQTVLSRQSNFREPADKDDVPMQVQALNQCLNQLSREIAEAMRVVKVD